MISFSNRFHMLEIAQYISKYIKKNSQFECLFLYMRNSNFLIIFILYNNYITDSSFFPFIEYGITVLFHRALLGQFEIQRR